MLSPILLFYSTICTCWPLDSYSTVLPVHVDSCTPILQYYLYMLTHVLLFYSTSCTCWLLYSYSTVLPLHVDPCKPFLQYYLYMWTPVNLLFQYYLNMLTPILLFYSTTCTCWLLYSYSTVLAVHVDSCTPILQYYLYMLTPRQLTTEWGNLSCFPQYSIKGPGHTLPRGINKHILYRGGG